MLSIHPFPICMYCYQQLTVQCPTNSNCPLGKGERAEGNAKQAPCAGLKYIHVNTINNKKYIKTIPQQYTTRAHVEFPATLSVTLFSDRQAGVTQGPFLQLLYKTKTDPVRGWVRGCVQKRNKWGLLRAKMRANENMTRTWREGVWTHGRKVGAGMTISANGECLSSVFRRWSLTVFCLSLVFHRWGSRDSICSSVGILTLSPIVCWGASSFLSWLCVASQRPARLV